MRRLLVSIAILSTLMAGCAAATGESVAPSPSAAPDSPAPSASEEPTPTPEPTQSPPQQPTPSPATGLAVDTVVATTVEGLSVRHGPGTAAEKFGFLQLGTVAYVLAGPIDADGFPWYRIAGMGLPYASGCITTPPDQPIFCPAFQGWVAGASETGDPWLAPSDVRDCPEPSLTEISETGFTWRLVCWADEPITFEAWWPQLPADTGGDCPQANQSAGFLYCQHTNDKGLAASPEEGAGLVNRLSLSIDPTSGVTMPDRGQWIRVTGTFDHPAAAACADLAAADEDPDAVVFRCRIAFVPTAVEALGTDR